MNKKLLREQIRQQRKAMPEEDFQKKSQLLARKFFATEQYRNANALYGYISFGREVQTLPILEQALRDGKRVAVPKVYGDTMRFLWVEDFSHLEKSSFGVPEPVDDGPVACDPEALVLMPGLAFDPMGNRLGYGGGYYDKFLAAEPGHPTVALCFAFQMLPQVLTQEFDVPADLVLWV